MTINPKSKIQMIRGFILEMCRGRNAICPRLLLLVRFASVSESWLQMEMLPDDFVWRRLWRRVLRFLRKQEAYRSWLNPWSSCCVRSRCRVTPGTEVKDAFPCPRTDGARVKQREGEG